MERNLMAQIAKYLSSHRQKKIGYWVLCSLGAVVVFCTTYALILPAITMSNDPICGYEAHTHDTGCWTMQPLAPERELICEEQWREADVVFHTHNEFCRNAEGKLICTLMEREQHTHSEVCYVEQRTPICGKTAGEAEEPGGDGAPRTPVRSAHVHTDACYRRVRGEQVCGLEEAEGHQHDDALCYTDVPTGERILVCVQEEFALVSHTDEETGETREEPQQVHMHTDECYMQTVDHVLTCPLEESEGHVHSDACFQWEQVLTCPEEEDDGTQPEPEEPAESVHVHTEACYEITPVLICREEEVALHTHGPECYEMIDIDDGLGGYVKQEVLTCREPVVIEHQHTAECVVERESEDRMVEIRTCGLVDHVHTDECYVELDPDVDPYHCGLGEHFHTDSCYFPESGELRCNMPEHTHTDECKDADNAPKPVYPLVPPDGTDDPDDGLPGDGEPAPDGDGQDPAAPELGAVQINDTYEYETDAFVMTFHVDGIALPVLEDGGADGEIPDEDGTQFPALDHEVTPETRPSGPDTNDVSGTVEPTVKPEPSAPADTGADHTAEPPADTRFPADTQSPADAQPPVDTQTPADTQPPEDIQPPTDAQPPADTTPLPVEDEDEEFLEDEDFSPEFGRLLSMNPYSSSVPLASQPFEDSVVLPDPPDDVTPPADSTVQPTGDEEAPDSTVTPPQPDSTVQPETDPPVQTETTPSAQPEYGGYDSQEPSGSSDQEPQIEFRVQEVTEGEGFDALMAQMGELLDEDDLIAPIQVMEISAFYKGVQLDLTGCQITVEVQPTPQLAEAVSNDNLSTMDLMDGVSAPEDGTEENPGLSVTLLSLGGEPQNEIIDGEELETAAFMMPKARFMLTSNGRSATYATGVTHVVNPRFKVQFYANLNAPESTGGTLPFINTSKSGLGHLPQHGDDDSKIKLDLNSDGTIKFKVRPTKVYADETREFNPKLEGKQDVVYINSLRDNEHYTLKEIWVLKPSGRTPPENLKDSKDIMKWMVQDSADRLAEYEALSLAEQEKQASAFWDIRKDTNIILSNEALKDKQDAGEGKKYLSVDETSIIRLVYDPANSTLSIQASFFDYDVSTGPNNAKKIDTRRKGINSASNYANDGGAKYGFGNDNINSGLGKEAWNGKYTLNKANEVESTTKCTYGLVTGMTPGGSVQFSDGIDGPKNLFGDGAAEGKHLVSGVNGLTFKRAGDTFTLFSVNGAGANATNLDIIGNPSYKLGDIEHKHTAIWTNNFWPLDDVWNTDPHTGKVAELNAASKWSAKTKEQDYINSAVGEAEKTAKLPVSDDSKDHNNYFGMSCSIDFDLVKEYVGPLEYYFYGDDDMWVFLTDLNTGKSQLVCDIGGVHSSVGEYVDLWDYIGDRENHEMGKYRLNIFYTERGASGSTCWMQFTLPQISQVYSEPYVPENTALRVKKMVSGTDAEKDMEFRFSLQLQGLSNRYQMNYYNADGTLIVPDPENPDPKKPQSVSDTLVEFTLKDGEYVDVIDLAPGVRYEVQELYNDHNCVTSITGAEEVTGDTMAVGSIVADKTTEVVYTNSFLYTLPSTGGPSAAMYTLGGALLIAAAAGSLVYKKKSGRRGAADRH